MNGQILPLVMLPRYSSFVGAEEFSTVPLDVSEFSDAAVRLWRGDMVGDGPPTFRAYFETSTDALEWSAEDPSGVDPGANASTPVSTALKQKWFRVRIVLGGTKPGVSCWCAGHLVLRVS